MSVSNYDIFSVRNNLLRLIIIRDLVIYSVNEVKVKKGWFDGCFCNIIGQFDASNGMYCTLPINEIVILYQKYFLLFCYPLRKSFHLIHFRLWYNFLF